MLPKTLLDELNHLSRIEKLRVVQILVDDLAREESAITMQIEKDHEHEIWSPFDAFDAAATVQAVPDDYKHNHGNA